MQYACNPSRFSEPAEDFVRQLLRKEPESRLGNLRNGSSDVMAHAWFYDLNWDQLLRGELPAPFLPTPMPRASGTAPSASAARLDLKNTITDKGNANYWSSWDCM